MSSAQLEILTLEDGVQAAEPEGARPGALRQQAAERLAAHRLRRARHGRGAVEASVEDPRPEVRHKIAAAVAERYAHSPSYRSFLAEEAQRAIRQAAAAAEVAVRSAEAVAAVQQELLAELELWTAPQVFTAKTACTVEPEAGAECGPVEALELESSAEEAVAVVPARRRGRIQQAGTVRRYGKAAATAALETVPEVPVKEVSAGGLTVRLYEDLGQPSAGMLQAASGRIECSMQAQEDIDEALALDEEIAFRQTPVFDNYRDFGGSVETIAANLVEFPRQLVATKKARPRLAEGPLREETPRSPQLRIFEVEPEQISTVAAPPSVGPEWSSIRLSAHSLIEAAAPAHDSFHAVLPSLLPPQTAPVSLRMMAVAVDLVLVLTAFLAFAAAAARISGTVPTGMPAGMAAAGTIAVFYLGYQLLFFTFSDQTPGMRYARIGLCTFTDENPSRSAMRRRILAMVIAACPLGIGLLWMWLDDDRLGWHDRISRMYQRAY